jgi:hypothetical protein
MLRPVRTRWFEMLVARDALAPAVGVLATSGRVQLETRSDVPQLEPLMEEYQRLVRRYHPYWPDTGLQSALRTASPTDVLTAGLEQLRAWEQAAAPRVQELESCTAEQAELRLVQMLVTRLQDPLPDLALLEGAVRASPRACSCSAPALKVRRCPARCCTAGWRPVSAGFCWRSVQRSNSPRCRPTSPRPRDVPLPFLPVCTVTAPRCWNSSSSA